METKTPKYLPRHFNPQNSMAPKPQHQTHLPTPDILAIFTSLHRGESTTMTNPTTLWHISYLDQAQLSTKYNVAYNLANQFYFPPLEAY